MEAFTPAALLGLGGSDGGIYTGCKRGLARYIFRKTSLKKYSIPAPLIFTKGTVPPKCVRKSRVSSVCPLLSGSNCRYEEWMRRRAGNQRQNQSGQRGQPPRQRDNSRRPVFPRGGTLPINRTVNCTNLRRYSRSRGSLITNS